MNRYLCNILYKVILSKSKYTVKYFHFIDFEQFINIVNNYQLYEIFLCCIFKYASICNCIGVILQKILVK